MKYLKMIDKITHVVMQTGYATEQPNEKLSGYEIMKYFIEKTEKYKFGMCPSSVLSLSKAIPRLIYDGIAYQQYMGWKTYREIWGYGRFEEKNYYYFRYNHAFGVDMAYNVMMNPESEFRGDDEIIVYSLFQKIEKIVQCEIVEDISLETNCGIIEDNNLKYLFERLHVLGRSIFLSWKENECPRFRLVKSIICDTFFNPFRF